jgi:sugar phosphate permease
MVTCGTSLMVIYNVNSIAVAVSRSPSSFFIALISMANGFGRVSSGYFSDKIKKYMPISKLQMLNAIIVGMGCSQFLLSLGISSLLEPCLLAIGFLFGCNVSLMAVNVADIFGSRYIATNFGLVDTAPIFGSYIFATWVVTAFYEDNVEGDDGSLSCEGVLCFRTAFLVNMLCCLFASALCTYLSCVTPRNKETDEVY